MSKDKAEEKARGHAKKICEKSYRSQCEVYDHCTIFKERIKNYIIGYNQAVTALSIENGKLKEVLSLAYDLIRDSTEYEVEIGRYKEGLLKINQLLTNTQENEKEDI
ncbi:MULTISPECIES: hypothetical protein [unclassified Dysgonomonas]|jgi:hypothetical protein|uniref:hypothetical protein n=1 Tax=unclassified Dysgonomonas TaxID=2630389 RepID=UPI0025C6BB1F|nr:MULTISPECIES: hypothetical protein [unclassified Dysgonomonas]MDR2002495.1 hypothetical protein [Prevotella sp.]HMM02973.1 hypothetical protein [Dysgonomonas sp.]